MGEEGRVEEGREDKKSWEEVSSKKKKEKKRGNYGIRLILRFSSHEDVVSKVFRMWDYKQIKGSLMCPSF